METLLVFNNILAAAFCVAYDVYIFCCSICLTLLACDVGIKFLIFPWKSQWDWVAIQTCPGWNRQWNKHNSFCLLLFQLSLLFLNFSVLCWASLLLWDFMHQLDCSPLLMLMYEVLEQDRNCNAELQVVVPTSSVDIYFCSLFCL